MIYFCLQEHEALHVVSKVLNELSASSAISNVLFA